MISYLKKMTTELREKYFSYKLIFPLAAILVILAVVLMLIPGESIMGAGIKYVYLHVLLLPADNYSILVLKKW